MASALLDAMEDFQDTAGSDAAPVEPVQFIPGAYVGESSIEEPVFVSPLQLASRRGIWSVSVGWSNIPSSVAILVRTLRRVWATCAVLVLIWQFNSQYSTLLLLAYKTMPIVKHRTKFAPERKDDEGDSVDEHKGDETDSVDEAETTLVDETGSPSKDSKVIYAVPHSPTPPPSRPPHSIGAHRQFGHRR